LLVCSWVSSASAAWWEFGKREGEPAITELKINAIDATRLVDSIALSRDDLVNGIIVVRGKAEVRPGAIGLVEYSIDGGKLWRTATLGDRGVFSFDIRPDTGRGYVLVVRAITTVGRQTDDSDYTYKLSIGTSNSVDDVRKTFQRMLEAYRNKNRTEFMSYVSDDFQGIVSALDEAVSNDFRNFDNIRIEPNITRVSPFSNGFEIYFTFNRQVFATRNGRLLKDAAASTMMFKREGDGFKLVRLAAPLIFGVSNPTDVATSVTNQSVGQQVIVVNPNTGTATTSAQTATTPTSTTASSTLDTGTISFSGTYTPAFSYSSFAFANGGTRTNGNSTSPAAFGFAGDFAFNGVGNLVFKSPASVRACGTTFTALTTAPTTGYTAGNNQTGIVGAGQCYVFQLIGPKYAAIEIISFSTTCPGPACGNSVSFRYKYQNDGTTSLQ
jgi:hypothetical protein